MKISACIITRNEHDNLPRCLRSIVSVVDEIVVLDSGSTDDTLDIARCHGAQTFHKDWAGYVSQKNHALSLARHDWVLSLDADEELSPALRSEILQIKAAEKEPDVVGFVVSRVVFFEGQWIRFGDWYPDLLPRLFLKKHARFEGGSVHERLELDGPTRTLSGELHHYTYKNRIDQIRRLHRYSTLWAQQAYARGKTCSRSAPYIHSWWRIFRAMVLKGGWRGGVLGWRIALASAMEVRLKYQKLIALHQGRGR